MAVLGREAWVRTCFLLWVWVPWFVGGTLTQGGTQNAVSVLQSGCSLHWWMCSTCGDFFTQASSSFSHRSSSPASAISQPRPPHPVPAIRTIKTGIQRTEMAAWVLDSGRFAEKPSSTGLFYASSHQAGSCLFL